MTEIYKGYEIDTRINEWGYFEATSISDCDAAMIFSKTIKGLKTEIDYLKTEI